MERDRLTTRRSERVLVVLLLVLCALGFSASSPIQSSPRPSAAAPTTAPPPRGPLVPPEPLSRSATMRQTVIEGREFSYCANGSVDSPAHEITRVIVVVHGNDRQPCSVASAALAAGTPEQRAETLVVAPRFPTRDDRINPNTQLFWTFASWSQGNVSANDDVRISSFAVVDELLDRLRPRPIVVAGFSGGGQFVGRYAAGTTRSPLRFVITNPSSYLYFTPDRPTGTPDELRVNCPDYNEYRYGLEQLNEYMSAAGGEQEAARRFARHRLVLLLGDADNDPRSSSMDRSCAAAAQGANRFERGLNYWIHLSDVYGPEIHSHHRLVVVPKVSHNVHAMFQYAGAREVLYE